MTALPMSREARIELGLDEPTPVGEHHGGSSADRFQTAGADLFDRSDSTERFDRSDRFDDEREESVFDVRAEGDEVSLNPQPLPPGEAGADTIWPSSGNDVLELSREDFRFEFPGEGASGIDVDGIGTRIGDRDFEYMDQPNPFACGTPAGLGEDATFQLPEGGMDCGMQPNYEFQVIQ